MEAIAALLALKAEILHLRESNRRQSQANFLTGLSLESGTIQPRISFFPSCLHVFQIEILSGME
jgi:hypothetical protein